MDMDQNWYRQLATLVLLSASRAAVDYLTNPGSREITGKQLANAFSEIDYNALAKSITGIINDVAESSKDRLDKTIDQLREQSVQAVDEAAKTASKKSGQSSGGGWLKWLVVLALGGVVGYFLYDEQRRDQLLDRLTGASGPIQQAATNVVNQTESTAQQAANSVQQATGAPEQSGSGTQATNPSATNNQQA